MAAVAVVMPTEHVLLLFGCGGGTCGLATDAAARQFVRSSTRLPEEVHEVTTASVVVRG